MLSSGCGGPSTLVLSEPTVGACVLGRPWPWIAAQGRLGGPCASWGGACSSVGASAWTGPSGAHLLLLQAPCWAWVGAASCPPLLLGRPCIESVCLGTVGTPLPGWGVWGGSAVIVCEQSLS